jgi:hypothetical protein
MPKQTELFNAVLAACKGETQNRYFFFGGAIRGGKTYAVCTILKFLCGFYAGSKWHVVRKDMTVLKGTTIPTFEKVIAGDNRWKWTRDAGNYHVTFLPNGAKIFFKPESLFNDPELNDFLGLETNGFFLEQIEELSRGLWDRAIERAGSWYLDKMPPAFIFSTFNPTKRWVKGFVHDSWVAGKLEAPYFYIQALTADNQYITADQWNAWENMDEQTRRNLIEGSWEFEAEGNSFIYSLREKPRHEPRPGYAHIVDGLQSDPNLPLIASFDFNVEPITSLICQHAPDRSWVSILKEYRLLNSDVFELTDRIATDYPDVFWGITGDASGRNRTAITRGNKNYYYFIKQRLRVNDSQIKLPGSNPSVSNSRVLSNSLLAKHPAYLIDSGCRYLLEDMRQVQTSDTGGIDKTKNAHQSHLLDCWLYYNWNYHRKFLQNIPAYVQD